MSVIENLKKIFMKNIVIPALNPHLDNKFFQIIMLFGPPGDGKTILAESRASILKRVFIYVINLLYHQNGLEKLIR